MLKKCAYRLWIFAVFLLLCAGCSGHEDRPVPAKKKAAEETMKMTDEEKRFLKSIYIDEKRIEDGLLYSYQEKMLLHYRLALEYLHEKYPGYTFQIQTGSSINKLNTRATFHFTEKNTDGWFDLYLDPEAEDECLTDNFYGAIIREAYDAYIYNQCIDSVPSLLGTYSVFGLAGGIAYDENLTVEEVISGEKPLSVYTRIHLAGEPVTEEVWEQTLETVEKTIKDKGIHGAYIVFYHDAETIREFDPAEYFHEMKAEILYKNSFQYFR